MSTSEPEGWTISEYKSFRPTIQDSDTSTDEDSEDDEQFFAKSNIVRKPKYKKLVKKEDLLPE